MEPNAVSLEASGSVRKVVWSSLGDARTFPLIVGEHFWRIVQIGYKPSAYQTWDNCEEKGN